MPCECGCTVVTTERIEETLFVNCLKCGADRGYMNEDGTTRGILDKDDPERINIARRKQDGRQQ